MRIVPSLLAIVLAGSAAPLAAATIAETLPPHDIEMAVLVERPKSFEGMRVRFRCTFVQTGSVFSSYHTQFGANQYMNLIVWDDDTKIWEPTERAQALVSLYYNKRGEQATAITALDKYQLIEVTGEVVSDFRDEPWILCHSVEPLQGLGTFTDNAIYHIEQAKALDAESRHELANEHFVSSLSDNLPIRSRIDVQLLQAENLVRGKDYEDAIVVLTEAIGTMDRDPDLPRAAEADLLYLRAKARSEQGERLRLEGADPTALFEAAVADAARSIEIDPADGDTYAVHGISLAGLERFDEAKRQCERAIRLRPDNAEVRWYLGRILDLQESYEEAITVLKQAIDLSPKDYRLHKAIGKTYFNRSKLGGAGAATDIVTSIREYDIAIRLQPTDADLHYWRGVVIEVAAGRDMMIKDKLSDVKATHDMAIESLRNCLAVDEKYTEAHLRLGNRLRAKEQHNEAADHFKRAIELEPGRFQLYQELGRYLWDLDRRSEAREIFAAFHEREPQHIDTLYALGRISYELARGDTEDSEEAAARRAAEYRTAIDWHLQLLRLEPEHGLAHADLAESHYELGDHRAAISHADKALANLSDEGQILRSHRFKGLALAGLDQQQEVALELDGRTDGATDARLPLALGWSLTVFDPARTRDEIPVDASGSRLQALAQQALAIAEGDRSATELLGWGQYLAGDFVASEKTLAPLAGDGEDAIAYRLGMSLYGQGPTRYAEAKPLLEQAYRLRSRLAIHREVRNEARQALREITVYERQVARDAAVAAKQAAADERKRKAEEARKAKEEARKKPAE